MKLTISGYQNGNICNKKKKSRKEKTKNSNKNDNGNIKKSFPKLNKKKTKNKSLQHYISTPPIFSPAPQKQKQIGSW